MVFIEKLILPSHTYHIHVNGIQMKANGDHVRRIFCHVLVSCVQSYTECCPEKCLSTINSLFFLFVAEYFDT